MCRELVSTVGAECRRELCVAPHPRQASTSAAACTATSARRSGRRPRMRPQPAATGRRRGRVSPPAPLPTGAPPCRAPAPAMPCPARACQAPSVRCPAARPPRIALRGLARTQVVSRVRAVQSGAARGGSGGTGRGPGRWPGRGRGRGRGGQRARRPRPGRLRRRRRGREPRPPHTPGAAPEPHAARGAAGGRARAAAQGGPRGCRAAPPGSAAATLAQPSPVQAGRPAFSLCEIEIEIHTLERTPAWTQGAAPYALPTNAVQAMRLPFSLCDPLCPPPARPRGRSCWRRCRMWRWRLRGGERACAPPPSGRSGGPGAARRPAWCTR